DSVGNAYVAGETNSTNFPIVNALQPVYGGVLDGFAAKLSPDGSSMIYSTYVGGSNFDQCFGIAVDSAGNAYLTGGTISTDFGVSNGYQLSLRGPGDAFVVKLSPSGSRIFSTFLGGSDGEEGRGIAVDSAQNIYVTGDTSSSDFPTKNPYQSFLNV